MESCIDRGKISVMIRAIGTKREITFLLSGVSRFLETDTRLASKLHLLLQLLVVGLTGLRCCELPARETSI